MTSDRLKLLNIKFRSLLKGAGETPLIFFYIRAKDVFLKPSVRSFLPAILWFAVATFLLLLPGNNFPEAGFLNFPHRDKLVHITFFFIFSYSFSWPFKSLDLSADNKRHQFFSIAWYGVAYGIVIEFVQKYFVANRSFDVWDILSDTVGSFLGYWWCVKFFIQQQVEAKK